MGESTAPTPQYKIDDVVARYVALRDQKDKINADAKAQTEALSSQMKVIEGWIHQKLQEMGVESFKTDFGTAFKKMSDFANVSDWKLTLDFIREHEAWNMLKKDINKTAVVEFITEHGVPPPGVNYGMKEEVQVRRK